MTKRRMTWWMMYCLLVGLCLPTGCSTIDEDMSDCGQDYRLDYELKLITNLVTELETELSAQTDEPVAAALYERLRNVFSDYAHDVNLGFYNTTPDSALSHHEEEMMNANQSTYTIYLPVKEYMHLALANIAEERVVKYIDNDRCHTACLYQMEGDTLESHNTGLFTARQSMEVIENQNQSFYVPLFMANSAAALVVDTVGHPVQALHSYVTDVADAFYLRDSVYTYRRHPLIRAQEVPVEGGTQACFTAVCFPSRNVTTVRSDASPESEDSYWTIQLYVTLPDGSITENLLYVREPLKAGELKVVKVRLKERGEVEAVSVDVGVSVTLDWKPGGEYHPEL